MKITNLPISNIKPNLVLSIIGNDTVLDFQMPAVQSPGYQSEFPLVGLKGLLAAAFLDGIVSARKHVRAKMGQKIRREAREWGKKYVAKPENGFSPQRLPC